jgi:coenzyme PQQ precursor peptide PqqA
LGRRAAGAAPGEPPGQTRTAQGSIRSKEFFMKWETPQAVDFRFGMEITMYIAHR